MSTHHAPAPSRRGRYEAADPRQRDSHDWDDWDDDYAEPDAEPQVLWGRVAIFAVALLGAFLVGRVTAGDDADTVAALQERVAGLTTDLEQARADLDAIRAGGTGGPAAGGAAEEPAAGEQAESAEGDDATSDAAESADAGEAAADAAPAESGAESQAATDTEAPAVEAEAPAVEGEAYTVEAGDNLFGLAEQFYGDGQQWRTIAEANNLPAGAVLSPGQELIIPDAP